jgi:exosome complex component RRP46
MSVATVPSANLSILGRADGSAQFSQHGYTVIGTVNGPIEVQRRDANPEKAVVEVTVRPATGVGGTHIGNCMSEPF